MPTKRHIRTRLESWQFITRTYDEATPEEISADPEGIWFASEGKERIAIRVCDLQTPHLLNCMKIVQMIAARKAHELKFPPPDIDAFTETAFPIFKRLRAELDRRMHPEKHKPVEPPRPRNRAITIE